MVDEAEISEEVKIKRRPKTGLFIVIAIALLVTATIIYLQIKPSEDELLARKACIENEMHLCQAILTDNETWCDSAKDKEYCNYLSYLGKASKTNNASWCGRINETISGGNALCMGFINKNSAFCTYSNESENIKNCELIISAKEDSNLCRKIAHAPSKGFCLVLNTRNEAYCEDFADDCYKKISIQKN